MTRFLLALALFVCGHADTPPNIDSIAADGTANSHCG